MRKRYPGNFKAKVAVAAIKIRGHHCRVIVEVRGPQGSNYAVEKRGPDGFTGCFLCWEGQKKARSGKISRRIIQANRATKSRKRLVKKKP